MSFSNRMKLLCCLVTTLMVAGVILFQYNDRIVIDSILQQRIKEKTNTLDELLRLKNDPLKKLVTDYTLWNDMVNFVTTGDPGWAHDNIDPILQTYDTDAYWVFDASGHLVRSLTRQGSIVSGDRCVRLAQSGIDGNNRFPKQYFADLSGNLLELNVASIHHVTDTRRTGKVYGYFVIGRLLDKSYFKDIAQLTLSKVELGHGSYPATSYDKGVLTITRSFADRDNRNVAQLLVYTRLAEVDALHTHNRIHLVIGMLLVVLFTIASYRVINHEMELARAKENLDEAQELAGTGSWERDLITGKGYWSENYYHLMGLAPQAIAPSVDEFFQHVHEDDRERVRTTVQESIRQGNNSEIEFHLANDKNRIFLSKWVVVTTTAGKPVRMLGSVQDVTEKRHQDVLREELLKHREEFITRLSHDLKTPLTPLVALLPLIRKHAANEKVQEWVTLCINSVDHMKELVVKTIKLARYSSPARLLLHPVDIGLAAAVDDYIAKRSDIIRQKDIVIESRISGEILVHADALELEEVFYNLISNAVKYSPAQSRVVIAAIRDDQTVTVSVNDQGIGLSADELPHIFEEFFKADSSRHELDSSGLGLSICRRIIENHGGSIWATSPGAGQGTTIQFTIAAGGAV